jgi:GT2 family glycosyltransferase
MRAGGVSPVIDSVAVVIPVNNEATHLPACIAGLQAAVTETRRRYPAVLTTVRFALDRCTDDSVAVIRDAGLESMVPELPGVGAARAAGVAAALVALDAHPDHRVLIANTDADSVVPPDWLTHMIELTNAGADIVVGAVRPDEQELDDDRRRAWEATHRDGQARGHVHGANLGIRANFYLAVGGFAPVTEHEDVDLVARAKASGARIRATDANCVVTSGRLEGRTSGGYAGYLRDQLLPLAESVSQSVA